MDARYIRESTSIIIYGQVDFQYCFTNYLCLFFETWQSTDQAYLEALIQQENEDEEEKKQQLQFMERQTKNQKKRDKEALIDELVSWEAGTQILSNSAVLTNDSCWDPSFLARRDCRVSADPWEVLNCDPLHENVSDVAQCIIKLWTV